MKRQDEDKEFGGERRDESERLVAADGAGDGQRESDDKSARAEPSKPRKRRANNGGEGPGESDISRAASDPDGADLPPGSEAIDGPRPGRKKRTNGGDGAIESEIADAAEGLGRGDVYVESECRDDPDPALTRIIADIGATSRHWRTMMRHHTGTTNGFKGLAKNAAVARLRAAGEDLPDGAMPKETQADNVLVASLYPELFDVAAIYDLSMKHDEKIMTALVKLTPAWPFVQSVKGLGAKGVGHVLGIAGNLSRYPHPRKLVKMLGVAPRGSYPMSDAGKPMVPGQRRAIMLYHVLDPLLRQQNAYRDAYLAEKRRQVELNPDYAKPGYDAELAKPTNSYCDRKARIRVMTILIYDLWAAWRGEYSFDSDLDDAP